MSAPLHPPAEWFQHPGEIPTDKRVTVTADGRAYGYVALWDTCHVGLQGCKTPPKGSPTNYEYAHQGETQLADGSLIRTANIGGGAGHAPIDSGAPAEFYENTSTQLMRVRYGEDANGLWFSGALWPDVNDLDRARLLASSISGDWRWFGSWRETTGGAYDFAGACLVNIPGYPINEPGSITDLPGHMMQIAASLAVVDGVAIMAGPLPYHQLPYADRDRPWDAGAAKMRVEQWAASASGEIDWSRFGRAFLWVDSADPQKIGSYKLPFADIVNGELTCIPRGVFAAQGRLGQTQIPASDKTAIQNNLKRHYAAMAEKFNDPTLVQAAGCGCGGSVTVDGDGGGAVAADAYVAPVDEPVDLMAAVNMKLDEVLGRLTQLDEALMQLEAQRLANKVAQ